MAKNYEQLLLEHMQPGQAYRARGMAPWLKLSESKVYNVLNHLVCQGRVEKILSPARNGRQSYLYHLYGKGPVVKSVSDAPRAYRNLRLTENLTGYDRHLMSHMKLVMETRR